MLEEVSRLLARIGSSGSFATRRTAAAEDLNLEVQSIGRIRFPITPAIARKLCEVARPARYGFKDQTRLDRLRRDLGLPDGCRLKAQLHNLLVYGPGHFFTTHQDSEKADDMIGTLAQTQRAHIHDIVESRELPVRHTTRRTGRPFTLMLEKTAAVFECDAADRRSWQNDLQWLKGTSGDF